MKKLLLLLSVALFAFTSCSNDDCDLYHGTGPDTGVDGGSGTTREVYINTHELVDPENPRSGQVKRWHYVSAKDAAVVGTAIHDTPEETEMKAKTNWDFAIQRLKVRTNSGTSSSIKDVSGGVYTFKSDILFANVHKGLLNYLDIATDVIVNEAQMGGGFLSESKSSAQVVETGPMSAGSITYIKTPVYVFRSADGLKYYKVEFTGYQNDAGQSGHVKFDIAEIL